MLTKGQIAEALEARGVGKKNQINHMLAELANLGVEQLDKGEDFTVPGLVKLQWKYRAKQSKGSRWKKGETRTGFGGVETVADSDSPPVTEQAKLAARPVGLAQKRKPSLKAEAQTAFFQTALGKAVRKRFK